MNVNIDKNDTPNLLRNFQFKFAIKFLNTFIIDSASYEANVKRIDMEI